MVVNGIVCDGPATSISMRNEMGKSYKKFFENWCHKYSKILWEPTRM